MNDHLRELVAPLWTHSPELVWGVSPESIYLACCAVPTDESIISALEPHHRYTILRTNDERGRDIVATLHEELLRWFGLVTSDGKLTDTGRLLVRTESPETLVPIIATKRSSRIDRFVKEFERVHDGSIPRGEIDGLCQDAIDEAVVVPLLASLGFGEFHPEGMLVDQRRVQLVQSVATDRTDDGIRGKILIRQLSETTPETVATICSEYLDTAVGPESVTELDEATGVAHLVEEEPSRTPLEEIESALKEILDRKQTQQSTLRKAIGSSTDNNVLTVTETELTIDKIASVLSESDDRAVDVVGDLLYSLCQGTVRTPVVVSFLEAATEKAEYEVYSALQSLPDVDCTLKDGILTFSRVPSVVDGEDLSDRYTQWVLDAYQTVGQQMEALQEVSFEESPQARERIISALFSELDDGMVSPTLFAYTLPDPDALGEERMDRYVDDVPELKKERGKLKQWKERRRPDTKRYKELTDRLFSRGLENELEEKVLRIMTPFDDDTFSEYASQVRSLVRNGYEVRLLTRHTRSQYEWERLRDNLLGELEENRENVTIRTYSRYKEYRRITGDPGSVSGEFGIHAKLQAIGHAEEGVALVGSANFMENSYNWNPECGAYTEDDNFVQAAIEFFDHVWELSAADEVDLEQLQEIPRKMRYPSYYT